MTGFDCMDCGVNTRKIKEYYTIRNRVWYSVTKQTRGEGMLCIGCLEKRLGRELTRGDFTDAPVNSLNGSSSRMYDRLKQI